ncbi:DUF2057 family protein [Erwiniaceae bacterium BAC15a-03b]|uniref:DUF2057 family protein n=1 Tax=Winslowiella arboricola TaxID=2978220 RepID=A0A9J6Q2B4_9GAMM|nr:DUF2057 family protein [Winslowiella arboricola]MCU5775155.1 DUF2057 family protein [Winslowiella arboricola]MCU5780391.1 DUF2057 family protein [Winslowiella arboricola]
MKLRLVLSGLIALLVAASCHATTLKLAPEIDLLVLDGRKISGSLLKGAEGLELERGEHQFLFRVEKTVARDRQYLSVPLIATFNAQAKSITISLPALQTLSERRKFDAAPDFQLIDDQGKEIASKRDRLLTSHNSDLEKAMIAYNRNGQVASVPRFAQPQATTSITQPPPADLALNDTPTERLLNLWYHQVDSATRQRLVLWMKALRAS